MFRKLVSASTTRASGFSFSETFVAFKRIGRPGAHEKSQKLKNVMDKIEFDEFTPCSSHSVNRSKQIFTSLTGLYKIENRNPDECEYLNRLNKLISLEAFQKGLEQVLKHNKNELFKFIETIPYSVKQHHIFYYLLNQIDATEGKNFERLLHFYSNNKLDGNEEYFDDLYLSMIKFNDKEYRLNKLDELSYFFDEFLKFYERKEPSISIEQQKITKDFISNFFLRFLFTEERAQRLFSLGLINLKIFLFWISRTSFSDYLNKMEDLNEWARNAEKNHISLTNSMIAELRLRRIDYTNISALDPKEISIPESEAQFDAKLSTLLSFVSVSEDNFTRFKGFILMVLGRQTFKELIATNNVQDVVHLIAIMLRYQDAHLDEILHENSESISEFIRTLYKDTNGYLLSLDKIISEPRFFEKYSIEINANNQNFIRDLCGLENSSDTKELLFCRFLFCLELVLQRYSRVLMDVEIRDHKSPISGHIYEFTSRLSEFLVNLVAYKDIYAEQKYLDLEMSDLEAISQNVRSSNDKSLGSPKFKENVKFWEMYRDVYKISQSVKWSPLIIDQLLETYFRISEYNVLTQKVSATMDMLFIELFDRISPRNMFKIIYWVTDNGNCSKELQELIIKNVILDQSLDSNLAELSPSERVEAIISQMYFLTTFEKYNSKTWGRLFEQLSSSELASTIDSLSISHRILLPKLLFIANLESGKNSQVSRYADVLERCLIFNKLNDQTFEENPFSREVGRLLGKAYYDFLEKSSVVEIMPVHFRQGQTLVICISERNKIANSGVVRGGTTLSIRLLTMLGFEVVIVENTKLFAIQRRNERISYLTELMKDVMRNRSRMEEEERDTYFNL